MIGVDLPQIVPADVNRDEIGAVSDDLPLDPLDGKIRVVAFDAGVNDLIAAGLSLGVEQRLKDGGISDIPNSRGKGAGVAHRDDAINSRGRARVEFRTDEAFGIDAELIAVSKSAAEVGHQLGTAGGEIISLVRSTKEKRPRPDAHLGGGEKKRQDDEREKCLFFP